MVYSFNELFYSSVNKWSTAVHIHTDESLEHNSVKQSWVSEQNIQLIPSDM